MPHFTIDYSANLESRVDLQALCDDIRKTAVETGLFELGAIRVRALRCDVFAIADAHPDNAFLNVTLKIGGGRDKAAIRRAGDHVFLTMESHLAPLFATPHFALSFYIEELDPELSWKTNAIHPRLRAAGPG